MRLVTPMFLVGMAACGGGGPDGPDATPADASPACALATTYQEFHTIQSEIFSHSCAFMDCHDATSPESMMDLTSANARDLLVNVDVKLMVASGWKRVVPGDPAMSYLMVLLGNYPGPLDPDVGTMPQNSPLLCKEKRAAVDRWIVAGALDN